MTTARTNRLCDEEKRNFWAGNYDEINRKLEMINWDELFADETPEIMSNKLLLNLTFL